MNRSFRLPQLIPLAPRLASALLALAACKPAAAPAPATAGKSDAPPPTPVVLEHEPDDVQHAQLIPPRSIVLGQITPGKKGAPDDDWYRVEAGPKTLLALHVELAAAEPVASVAPQPALGPLDAQLEMDNRNRNRLVLAHATASEPVLFPAVACFESCFVHLWGAAPAAYKLTVLGASPEPGQELEPNDRAIDATALAAGKSVQGTLATPDDEDWFRLTAQARAGQFLRVELSPVAGVRPILELRALSDGALLGSFEAAAAGEGIFLRDLALNGDLAPPEPPQLRPAVDAGAPPGADAGALAASGAGAQTTPAPAGPALHAAASAGPVDGGATADPSGNAAADGPDAGATGAAPPATNPSATQAPRAPSPENRPQADTTRGGAGAGPSDGGQAERAAGAGPAAVAPLDAGVTIPSQAMGAAALPTPPATSAAALAAPAATGEATLPGAADAGAAPQGYYLVVRSAPLTGEKRAPRGFNRRDFYTLATALEAGAPDLEAEPNDDPQHPNWIASTRTGYLAPAGDSDWYRVRNEGKSVLRAEVTGLSRADLELSIFTAPAHPGDRPALLARANEGGVREGEILPAVGIDGDALLLVQCAPRELDGVKLRDCEDRDTPYTLSVTLAADDGTLEREPNDNLEHAQEIAVPARVTGTLWPRPDVDVFRFQLDAPRTLSFRLSAVRGVDTMLTLRELRIGKHGRASAEVIGTADASRGEGREEILSVPLKPGGYAIEVASPRRDGSATQTYRLDVQ